ncbi:hypothetical protein C0063_16565 [Pseudoxanthomonas sp. KAs_5_3]|nr:hypothetical protein C0063_16565 [Pseudoxanthomonas sp. KAs_5_3]
MPARLVVSSIAAGLLLTTAFTTHAATFNGSGALTTDYVWRGTTQTQGDPAVQAGFKATADNGVYGAVWGSNVEFAPDTHASSEIDVTVGWGGALSDDWALDLNLTHYRYPSTTVELDWTEAIGTLTWKQNYWAQLGYSTEALATDDAGAYAQLGAKFPLNDQLRVEAAAGYYGLDDVYDDSYAHAQLGAVWAFKAPFELRVTAHATDRSAKRLFPGLAGSRVEAALQAAF